MSDMNKTAYRLGITVLVVLAILTVIEFVIATANISWTWIIFFIAILKAWFVIQNYMHLPRLFKDGEEH